MSWMGLAGKVLFLPVVLLLVALATTPVTATPVTSGLRLWLDATDADTFTFSSDNNVSQWDDKSTYGHHAQAGSMEPTLESHAIGGQPAVRFSRTTDYNTAMDIEGDFSIATNGRRTVFTVISYTAPSTPSTEYFILGTGLQTMIDVGNIDRSERLRLRNCVLSEYSDAGSVPTGANVLGVRSDQGGSLTTAYRNGTKIIDTSTYAFHWPIHGNLQVGGANWDTSAFVGDIAEVLLYDRTLSDSEMHSVDYYLRHKYNVSGRNIIPEPSSLLLAVVAILCLAGCRRRRAGA